MSAKIWIRILSIIALLLAIGDIASYEFIFNFANVAVLVATIVLVIISFSKDKKK